MLWARRIWLRLQSLFRRNRSSQQLDDEIQFHLEQQIAENVAAGMSGEEARYAAMRTFGNPTFLREETRDTWGWTWLEQIAGDVRYGARTLSKNPGFTAVAVLTLALGIGANTSIFTFINAVVIRTLPVERPSELFFLGPFDSHGDWGFSYPLFEAVRDENRTLAGVFVMAGGPMNVSVDGQAELAPGGGQYVSGSYFSTLGVEAIFGRTFTAEEDKLSGQNAVAVISYGYWRRRFALSPSVLGKTIYLNGLPCTIIGVTPPRFFGINVGHSPDITVPITMYPLLNPGSTELSNPGSWWLYAMGRLKPGVTPEQATADLSAVLEHYLEAQGPTMRSNTKGLSMRLEPGAWGLSVRMKGVGFETTLLMTLAGLVLLIACTNVANLLLARGAARQKEIAVRVAIGAGRSRLIRQLVTESLLLALLGGGVGFLLASWGTQGLLKFLPQGISSLDLSPDIRVFVFSGGISLLAGLLFGLVPAWRVTRGSLVQGLQGVVRLGATDPHRNRLRNGLVVSQVMLSMVLVFLAGLFTHSLRELLSVDLGFRPEHVLLLSIDPTLVGYQGPRLVGLYESLLEHVQAVPGVMSVSLSRGGLISHASWGNSLYVSGYVPQPGEDVQSLFSPVGPSFFRTAGIPILLGRDFGGLDNQNAPKVAIVNEAFARHFFGERDGVQRALGQMLGLGVNQNLGRFQVIGVAKDARQRRIDEPPISVVYFPFWDLPPSLIGQMTLEVRTSGEPSAMTNAIRKELLGVEKNLPIYGVKTLTQQVRESTADARMWAWLVSSFGFLALLLASVGLYGLVAYSTVRRTREIGIRMAFGAHHSEVFALVIREAMGLTALGVVIGLALALATGRIVSDMLYGISTADPLTILGASLLMFVAASLAGFLPARRATKVDPMVALRYE